MVRLAILITCLAGAIWFVGFYKMGEKPLSGHFREIYKSPVVQKKLNALEKGVDQKVDEVTHEAKKLMGQQSTPSHKEGKPALARAPMTAAKPVIHSTAIVQEEPKHIIRKPEVKALSTPAPAPQKVLDIRPSAGVSKTPAQDQLTDDDREGLNSLLAKKLKSQ